MPEVRKAVCKVVTKKEWAETIKRASVDAGTYRTYFDPVIDTLAGVLENRDKAQQSFEQSGSIPVVAHTNKGGNTNIVKNPALVVVDDLNKTALAYWRDLGLTPAGLKRINEDALRKQKDGGFSEILKGIGL